MAEMKGWTVGMDRNHSVGNRHFPLLSRLSAARRQHLRRPQWLTSRSIWIWTSPPRVIAISLKGFPKNLATLRVDLPDVMKGFSELARSASQDGALDKKTKELIALALGVAAHCDACIGFHVQALVKLGVTKAELEEALGMAVYMGGGPSLMYAANAVGAFEEFSATA